MRTVLFYRVVTVLLLGAVAALALSLGHALSEREAARAHTAGVSQEVAPSPAAPVPPPPPVKIVDLRERLHALDNIDAETGDGTWWLERSLFGGVQLRSLAYRQLLPLHLHRLTEEAILPVFGEVEVTHPLVEGGRTSPRVARPALGVLTFTPPYTAHAWKNLSSTNIALLLSFVSVPGDREVDGTQFLDGGDERLRMQAAPLRVDPAEELKALGAAPFRLRRLPMLDGRLDALAVAGEATIDAATAPIIVYVAAGHGVLDAAGAHAIRDQELVSIQPGIALHIKADAGAPLVMYVFEPHRLGVSEILTRGKKLYSQQDEELVIRDFFADRKGGVFLDVGAGHYKDKSTTLYLEDHLGWSGVAVDALAQYAADYAKFRPRTKFLNYLVTDKARGLQKFYKGQVLEVSSTSKRFTEDQQGSAAVTELEVPSATLTELLDAAGIKKVDFLSMDIEGHEPPALAGFAIDRFQPQLVCIEAKRATRDEIWDYFARHGYVRIDKYQPYDPFNWYFRPRASAR